MNDDTRSLAEKQSDESTVPVRQTPPPPSPVKEEKPKPKHSRAFSFVSILLLLALLGAGVLAYFWFNANQDNDSLRMALASSDDTVTQLRGQVSKLKSEDVTQPVTTPTTPDDKTLITQTVTAKIHAMKGSETSKPTVNILKQGAQFAYVNAGETGGFAAYILKKVDSQWVIVYSGQEKIPQATADMYGVPAQYQTGQ